MLHSTQVQASAGTVCRCGARGRQCYRDIAPEALTAVRSCYWSMSAELRNHLLRGLYDAAKASTGNPGSSSSDSESPGVQSPGVRGPGVQGPSVRRQPLAWQLCGRDVCSAVFAHLLGTTPRSIRKAMRGEIDRRRLRGQRALSSCAQVVEFFFYELYQSVGDSVLSLQLAGR